MSFNELLREIIGKLTGKQCEEKRKINLVEIFNKILFETIDEEKNVLILIDEANAMSPANLEGFEVAYQYAGRPSEFIYSLHSAVGQLELASATGTSREAGQNPVANGSGHSAGLTR